MNFNLCYLGAEAPFHMRRDFILFFKHALEDAGHAVNITWRSMTRDAVNLLIGGYYLTAKQVDDLRHSGLRYAILETEILTDGSINHNPQKCDFDGAYVPLLRGAEFVWDGFETNVRQMRALGAYALRYEIGYAPQLHEIHHRAEKDIDAYVFGALSPRRMEMLEHLRRQGLRIESHGACPTFLRNDTIARARTVLNLTQQPHFSHCTYPRIWYGVNNDCVIVSEPQSNEEGYMDYCITPAQNFSSCLVAYLNTHTRPLKSRAEMPLFKDVIARLIEQSVSGN